MNRLAKGRARWGPTPLPKEIVSQWPGDCRVCGKRIESGERALFQPWAVGGNYAHVACGWESNRVDAPKRVDLITAKSDCGFCGSPKGKPHAAWCEKSELDQ